MQAALAVTTALLSREKTVRGTTRRVCRRGWLWLMSLGRREQALGGRLGRATTPLGPLRLLRHLRAADGSSVAVGAIEAKFFANLCQALGCPERARTSTSTRPGPLGTRSRRLLHPDPRRVGGVAGADLVAPVLDIGEVAGHPQFAARGAVAPRRTEPGRARQLGELLAGTSGPARPQPCPTRADRDGALLKEAGVDSDGGPCMARGSSV